MKTKYYYLLSLILIFVSCELREEENLVYCNLPDVWNVENNEIIRIPIGDTPINYVNTLTEIIDNSTDIIIAKLKNVSVNCGKDSHGRDFVTVHEIYIYQTVKGYLERSTTIDLIQRGGRAEIFELLNPSLVYLPFDTHLLLFMQQFENTNFLTLTNPASYIELVGANEFNFISILPSLEIHQLILKTTS